MDASRDACDAPSWRRAAANITHAAGDSTGAAEPVPSSAADTAAHAPVTTSTGAATGFETVCGAGEVLSTMATTGVAAGAVASTGGDTASRATLLVDVRPTGGDGTAAVAIADGLVALLEWMAWVGVELAERFDAGEDGAAGCTLDDSNCDEDVPADDVVVVAGRLPPLEETVLVGEVWPAGSSGVADPAGSAELGVLAVGAVPSADGELAGLLEPSPAGAPSPLLLDDDEPSDPVSSA